ncbi:MAG: glycosyltransferase family 4 protein [Anaerolineales bacterium]|nr:glycosyltransferase family 4 protein [Anaerolineales bacterium]
MKVAVYLDRYRPEDGGAFTMQGDLLAALCQLSGEARHQFVVVSEPSVQTREQVERAGMEWLAYTGPGFSEKLNDFITRLLPSWPQRSRWRSPLERQLRGMGVDFAWLVGPRPLTLDLPYLVIVLDLQHRKQPWFPEVSEHGEWEARERGLAPFLRRAAGVVTGAQAGKQEIIDFFQVPAERIHTLPHPTPGHVLEVGSQSKPLPAGLQPGYLFYPAQFWAHKNHVNLLLALKHLREAGLRVPLVLVGSDYGNKAYVEQIITELGLGDQVHMLGFVDQPTLIALYRNALALSYLSFFGPENLPPLEAFALGCPVLAARVDGAEEQLGDAALLVDPADSAAIAAAITRLHKDARLRQRLVARGRKRATSWTAADFVRGVFTILDDFELVRRAWGR